MRLATSVNAENNTREIPAVIVYIAIVLLNKVLHSLEAARLVFVIRYRFEIGNAHGKQWCRDVCQFSDLLR